VKEIGILNRDISAVISQLGHQDEMILCDAGFAIPSHIPVVDVSIDENVPRVEELLKVIQRYFSIEGAIVANEFVVKNPSKAEAIRNQLGENVAWSTIDHAELKQRSKMVKAVIRTGDFTAYSNVLLVSGPGERWYVECPE